MAHAPPHLHDLAAARVIVFRMRDTAGRAPWQSSALPKGDQPALRLTQRRKKPEGPPCVSDSSTPASQAVAPPGLIQSPTTIVCCDAVDAAHKPEASPRRG